MPSYDPYTFVDFLRGLHEEDLEKEERKQSRKFWMWIYKLKTKRKIKDLIQRITKST